MFPRDERAADTAKRAAAEAALTPEQRDRRDILAASVDPDAAVQLLAEAWLGLLDEPHPEPYEKRARAALGRQLARREGRPITRDDAEVIAEHDPRDEWAEVDG